MNDKIAFLRQFLADERREYVASRDWAKEHGPEVAHIVDAADRLIRLCDNIEVIIGEKEDSNGK
jgi:hypothetical protein